MALGGNRGKAARKGSQASGNWPSSMLASSCSLGQTTLHRSTWIVPAPRALPFRSVILPSNLSICPLRPRSCRAVSSFPHLDQPFVVNAIDFTLHSTVLTLEPHTKLDLEIRLFRMDYDQKIEFEFGREDFVIPNYRQLMVFKSAA